MNSTTTPRRSLLRTGAAGGFVLVAGAAWTPVAGGDISAIVDYLQTGAKGPRLLSI